MPAPSDRFFAVRPLPLSPSFVEAWLERGLDAGRAAWPGVSVDADTFARAVARRVSHDATAAQLESMHLSDVYLAVACEAGQQAALAAFERHVIRAVLPSLERFAPDQRDDALQLLRAKLFVPRGDRKGAIADYRGQGPLVSWVRATAVRTALDAQRTVREHDAFDEVLELSGLEERRFDPELEALRRQHQQTLKHALHAAFAALRPEERNLLRLSVAEGLSLAKIGVMHQVHESTVSRWVAQARERLLQLTREHLAKLGLADAEVDSLLGVAHSQLDLSLGRMLRG
ncbi:MAG: sigma-70 family RNA polymerase sigma factor [Myxococcaceae bacterium]|nr:sigma-70 family RNA polymerase sigma factor [Myxococcaceae bacterium]